jgi:hypothetical protein
VSPFHCLRLIPALALSVILLSCLDPCENRILADSPSPGANKRAVIFERSCGATTGFSWQVTVLDPKEDLPSSSGGNVFIADSDHGAVKEMNVTMRWVSRGQLVILYPARARVFKKEAEAKGVSVAYETAP